MITTPRRRRGVFVCEKVRKMVVRGLENLVQFGEKRWEERGVQERCSVFHTIFNEVRRRI